MSLYSMDSNYMAKCHHATMNGNLVELRRLYQEYRERHPYYKDDAYVHTFRLLFTNACMFGKVEVAKWLYSEIYQKLTKQNQEKVKFIFKLGYDRAKKDSKYKLTEKWLEQFVPKGE